MNYAYEVYETGTAPDSRLLQDTKPDIGFLSVDVTLFVPSFGSHAGHAWPANRDRPGQPG
jgi:hypothetical protein